MHYLLALWTRLISSVPQKQDQPSLLSECMPKIMVAYVSSRLDSVAVAAQVRRLPCHWRVYVLRQCPDRQD